MNYATSDCLSLQQQRRPCRKLNRFVEKFNLFVFDQIRSSEYICVDNRPDCGSKHVCYSLATTLHDTNSKFSVSSDKSAVSRS